MQPDPTGAARAVVLIAAGSGPTDRDANTPVVGPRTDCLRQLATALAEAGFASLRYEKRSIGRSAAGASDKRALQVPLLVVHGAGDAQVDVEDGRLLAAARSGARLAIIDGLDHVLKRAAPDAASYADPIRSLAPGLADSILRSLDSPR